MGTGHVCVYQPIQRRAVPETVGWWKVDDKCRYFQVGGRVEGALASPSALGRAQEMHDHHSRGRHSERIESVTVLRGSRARPNCKVHFEEQVKMD